MNQEKSPVTKRLYTVKETAQILNIAPQSIYNAISRNKNTFPIKHKKLGKSVRFDIKDIESFIEKI
jgi:predicted DNA-binding transcriptional regulator AlpA